MTGYRVFQVASDELRLSLYECSMYSVQDGTEGQTLGQTLKTILNYFFRKNLLYTGVVFNSIFLWDRGTDRNKKRE